MEKYMCAGVGEVDESTRKRRMEGHEQRWRDGRELARITES